MLSWLTRFRAQSKNLSLPRRFVGTEPVATEDLYSFGVKHVTKGVGRITEGLMTKGEGSYVHYDDGRKYLDFTCGIGVTGLGGFFCCLSLTLFADSRYRTCAP